MTFAFKKLEVLIMVLRLLGILALPLKSDTIDKLKIALKK